MSRPSIKLISNDRFITGRLLLPYMRKSCSEPEITTLSGFLVVEAIRMAARGDATPEDIDTAMELGAGYRECCNTPDVTISNHNTIAMGVSNTKDHESDKADDLAAFQTARPCRPR